MLLQSLQVSDPLNKVSFTIFFVWNSIVFTKGFISKGYQPFLSGSMAQCLAQWLSRYRRGSIKTMRAQGLWFEARPDRTLSPGWDRKWGAHGPSGRLTSAKLVIHVKYGIFIYLFLFICSRFNL